MIANEDRQYLNAAWVLVICFTVFRFIYAGSFELAPDEANHWQWGRHLAWGYHDQAPLIGWAVRLGTFLLGNTETGVRLPSVVAMFIACLYMVSITGRWVGGRAAFQTAVLSQSVLLFNIGGLLATPDGLQAMAWAGAAYHVGRGYESDGWGHWLAGGVWFGVGLLAKYTMVLFGPCALAFGLLSPAHRQRLAGFRPWVGVALGSAMFLPVIFWNAQNGWNSVRHVAYIGGANQGFAIHLNMFGDYWASQAALLSPVVFILILMAWGFALSGEVGDNNWIGPYLFLISFPVFAFFMVLSLHSRVYGNWPGTAYVGAAVLCAAFFTGPRTAIFRSTIRRWGRRAWPVAVVSSYLISGVVLLQVVWPVLPLPLSLDRTATEVNGWQDVGFAADRALNEMPVPERTFLFGLRYQLASELAFYTPGHPETVSINRWKRPNVYDYWTSDAELLGWDAVGVTQDPDSDKTRLHEVFERVDPPVAIAVYRKNGPFHHEARSLVKTLYLYKAYGFKGGLRWAPPNRNDIRAGGNAK